ncbi:hypothetical protein HH310_36690 [Actinoplanes sp. TBRC 11911]|uniref:hypothetical protein n=1 Tax=Actinoplanes sp. TBRC 11911 TaxID=2729386 RepID=UPI00145DC400|nr:hypothetical protein [Actinoplanes sp. TBRC 11911]NMO56699.1 hypothetical protein [Actinoplanes sp. TBRC 11911]
MMDLHERLSRIAGAAGDTSAEQADADVKRGRRALRHRRAARGAGASVFVAAALVAAVTYGTSTLSQPASTPTIASAHLVAYQGEQPKGFTIDKVPASWVVQGVDAGVLTIAPVDAADKNPNVFLGKIAIMLQSVDDHSTPTGKALTVASKPGVISEAEGTGYGKNLWVKQPNGIWMQVQVWDARGWTEADLVEFAGGIHVLKDAVQGRG